VVIFTYPIIAEIRTHLANDAKHHDAVCFVWNNWWIHHALVDLHVKPYFTDYLMPPIRLDLRLHPLGLLYGVLSIPLIPLLGPIGVTNVQLLLTPVLNGYAAFLLLRRWFGRDDVAVLCGAALAVCPAIDFHLVVGRPSCAAIWPLVLSLLFLSRLIEEPRWRHCLALAGALFALLAVDQQMPIFGGLVLSLYLATVIAKRPRVLLDRRLIGYGMVVLVLIAYPVRILYVRPFLQTPGYTIPHPSEAQSYSVPPWLLVQPAHMWRAYGSLLPLGLLAAIAIIRKERRTALGIICALVCLSLTIGPVAGDTGIPMTFAALRRLPGLSQFRTPYRFQIPAALSMTLAMAGVLAYLCARLDLRPSSLWRRSRAQWLMGAMALALMADTIAHRLDDGFPTHRFPDEPIYRTIAETPGDFLVLEIPLGIRSGTDLIGRGDQLMLYQTIHGKRLINGYIGRIPYDTLDYYRRSSAFMFLANEPLKPPHVEAQVAADLDARLRSHRVGFIVVHPEMLESDRLGAILSLLARRADLEVVPTGTTTLAFRVRANPR
jgi:hypothetical protein